MMCLLGSRKYISSHGGVIPKYSHFADSSGDFQLKRLRAYIGTEETDHNAWWLKMRISTKYTMCNREKQDEVISGSHLNLFSKNSFQWAFQAKTPFE
jgi:hypothetical protein